MLSVAEALAAVLAEVVPQQPVSLPLEAALGHVLAADVTSDIDSPPYDKAMVDGFAVIADEFAAFAAGNAVSLRVIEEITAGDVPTRHLARGQAARIMTGAPIPPGATAVVMIEHATATLPGGEALTRLIESNQATVTLCPPGKVNPVQNIMRQGTSIRAGQAVLLSGVRLRSLEIGLLAEIGNATISVFPPPSVALLSTGNELVPPAEKPGRGQIRNSNGPMLAAAVREAGATPIPLGIVRDDLDQLTAAIRRGQSADALVLSGGVSAGVLDLVPAALTACGVREVFHHVSLKPGKPIWFGVLDRGPRRTLVFALPGNPVSSWVCFQLFVRPALSRLAGGSGAEENVTATLTAAYEHRGDRPTYHPAILESTDSGFAVTPLPWHGSADLAGFSKANALAIFEGTRRFEASSQTRTVKFD